MRTIVLIILLSPLCGFGMDRFSALSMIETGNDDAVVGRAGEISRYQLRKTVWQSVTNSVNYTDPETARVVASKVMDKRIADFRTAFGRLPTDFEFYGLWNAPTQVLQRRVSPVVAERCERFANLCERDRRVAAAGNIKGPSRPVLQGQVSPL